MSFAAGRLGAPMIAVVPGTAVHLAVQGLRSDSKRKRILRTNARRDFGRISPRLLIPIGNANAR